MSQLPDAIDLTAAARHVVAACDVTEGREYDEDDCAWAARDAVVAMWCDLIGMRLYPRLAVEIARALVERHNALQAFIPPFTYADLEG